MAQIISVLDKQIALGSEQYIRPMAWGSNWEKIRIGIRYNLYGSQWLPDGASGLGIGLCHQSAQYHDANADMVFYRQGLGYSIYWYSGNYFLYNQGQAGVIAKVGSNLTTVALGSNTNSTFGGAGNRFLMLLDVVKSGTSFTLNCWPASLEGYWNATVNDLYSAMESVGNSIPKLSAFGSGTANYAGSGLLDSVWIGWQTTVPQVPFCISEVLVSRFY
jgi:hypothetical protein